MSYCVICLVNSNQIYAQEEKLKELLLHASVYHNLHPISTDLVKSYAGSDNKDNLQISQSGQSKHNNESRHSANMLNNVQSNTSKSLDHREPTNNETSSENINLSINFEDFDPKFHAKYFISSNLVFGIAHNTDVKNLAIFLGSVRLSSNELEVILFINSDCDNLGI